MNAKAHPAGDVSPAKPGRPLRHPKLGTPQTRVLHLVNVGPMSARWLNEVGIATYGELASTGPVEAFKRIRRKHPEAPLHLLYALHGALQGKRWDKAISARERNRLRKVFEGDS